MGRQKHNCLYNGRTYEIASLAKMAGVSHDTMRGRLTRTAELTQIDGVWFYICQSKHLRPAKPVGVRPRKPKTDGEFSITRYSVSADGDKSVMAMAKLSQQWLAKKIRTRELPDEDEDSCEPAQHTG
jgi:hypothetical protein